MDCWKRGTPSTSGSGVKASGYSRQKQERANKSQGTGVLRWPAIRITRHGMKSGTWLFKGQNMKKQEASMRYFTYTQQRHFNRMPSCLIFQDRGIFQDVKLLVLKLGPFQAPSLGSLIVKNKGDSGSGTM